MIPKWIAVQCIELEIFKEIRGKVFRAFHRHEDLHTGSFSHSISFIFMKLSLMFSFRCFQKKKKTIMLDAGE